MFRSQTHQLTRCPWWQYSTYGVRFPLIAKRLACMVISSGTSPNALDILSHVNLSHGIPADVSFSAPCFEWVTRKWACANSLGIKRIQFSAIKLDCFRNFLTISQRKFFSMERSFYSHTDLMQASLSIIERPLYAHFDYRKTPWIVILTRSSRNIQFTDTATGNLILLKLSSLDEIVL